MATADGVRTGVVGREAFDALVASGTEAVAARARVTAGVVVAVAEQLGVELPPLSLLTHWGPPAAVGITAGEASPALPGAVYERLLDADTRRSGGAFYTPSALTRPVVGWALEGQPVERVVVCDPAVGGGAFLLAAAEALAGTGRPRRQIVAEALMGVDIDPVAVAVTEAVLALWCGGGAVPHMRVADVLTLDPEDWPVRPDVVVGNPPFLNQLGRSTARDRGQAEALRQRFGVAGIGYVDTAALFLVLATRLVRPGGAVALVLPESFLATRDARAARAAVLAEAGLEALWIPAAFVFDGVAVRVCVPVLRRDGTRVGPLRVWRDVPPRLVAEVDVDADVLGAAPTWSYLAAKGTGVPEGELEGEGVLGEWCEVSADFRQQYYGLIPFMVDDPSGELDDERHPPLVTTGLVDPAVCSWGRRATRHHRCAWEAPRIDIDRLEAESDLGPWAIARLVPKVVVATQTRVVEAAVDVGGRWLPSTPLISVVAPPERLWHAAAALLAPPVTAWALRHWGGTALAAGGLKLSAAQVRIIPSPQPGPDWDEAAEAVQRASEADGEDERRRHLLEGAMASTRAYGGDELAVVTWWEARLPRRRLSGRR